MKRCNKSILQLSILTLSVFLVVACAKPIVTDRPVDVVLIGGGIMSATLGSMLKELEPNLTIEIFEKLDRVAEESSSAWNNAGTGHASFSELNYTPQLSDGSIDIKKAIEVGEAFELSKQYWSYLVAQNKIGSPRSFINTVPHMSFVWGDENVAFLKKRHEVLTKHPLFFGMEYSDDHEQIKQWIPLVMQGRDANQKIAATRMLAGVDVDFGALTRSLIDDILQSKSARLHVKHDVINLVKNEDATWTVIVNDLTTNKKRAVKTKFVFIGAGGGALWLLQKSGIEEAKGLGGFPVGGAWLVTDNMDLIKQHEAKVYGKAAVGSPPMSVPHLDTRYINGKQSLLFGPFATFSTKFLKQGSWMDLFTSVSFSNAVPMLKAGIQNLDLVKYLVDQVLLSEEERLRTLKEYMPHAKLEDWRAELAGQRVQVIKKDKEKGGVLQFGTELVASQDGRLVALLGASPGASTAVKVMLDVLNRSFKDEVANEWQAKLQQMIPSFGQKLSDNAELIKEIRTRSQQVLELAH